MHFLIKTVTHERVKDSKGRLIPTVICDWISEQEKERFSVQKVGDEDEMLALIRDNPKASISELAIKMGWTLYSGEPHKSKTHRCVESLKKAKLITQTRTGKYQLTPEGKKALEETT